MTGYYEEFLIYSGERYSVYFYAENKANKIYCFKPKKERFFCFFFIGKKIIITSAYRKKRQKLDKRELKKAIDIRNQYLK